ncbi:MAG: plasminogen-binding N-terminal domain-containing protein [Wolinella sp.]
MRPIFALLFFVYTAVFASPFGNKIAVPILELDGNGFAYVPAFDLRVGESGEIIRWLDRDHSVIIARAAVVELNNGRAKVAFERFDTLDQRAFPDPQFTPQKNDEVIFRAFYDRAFLIAPSQELYQKVQSAYPEVSWQHPDLFASHLLDKGNHAPNIKDFRDICNAYNAGIVYIVNLNEGQARDCQTFGLLKHDYITGRVAVEERMKPFFSRLGNVEQSWFSFIVGGVAVDDYYRYYDALLKGEIKDEDTSFFGRIYRSIKIWK